MLKFELFCNESAARPDSLGLGGVMASRFRRRRRYLEEGTHIGGDLKAIIWRAVSEISAQKL